MRHSAPKIARRTSSTLTIVNPTGQTINQAKSETRVGTGRQANVRGTPKSPFVQRTGKWRQYSTEKNAWIAAHPNATSAEIDAAAKRIAKELGL